MADKSIAPNKWEWIKTFFDNIELDVSGIAKKLQLDTSTSTPVWSAGQFWYDQISGSPMVDMGIDGVRNGIGQEFYIPVYNNTGGDIADGTPVAGGGTYTGGIPNLTEADADNPLHILGFFGLATHTIPDGTVGLVTKLGAINGIDTSLLAVAPVYLASGGGLTNTIPTHPTGRLLIGGVTVSDAVNGVIGVDQVHLDRNILTLVYPFTSNGIGFGDDIYIAGEYDWNTSDANLTEASTSVTWGTSNVATGAHIGIVAGGAGVVDTGTVGIRVVGDSITDDGTSTIGDTEILTTDITTLSANQYLETAKNFSSIVTIELYESSGTPLSYSLDFNYGFSAYIDASNNDFTFDAIRVEGLCGGTDTSFDVRVIKHSNTGWSYSAANFSPGNGTIADFVDDTSPNSTISNGKNFKWKRTGLAEYINGTANEGFVISVDTSNNNAIQSMTTTVTVAVESII